MPNVLFHPSLVKVYCNSAMDTGDRELRLGMEFEWCTHGLLGQIDY